VLTVLLETACCGNLFQSLTILPENENLPMLVQKAFLYNLNVLPRRPVVDMLNNVLGAAKSKTLITFKNESYYHANVYLLKCSTSKSLIGS